MEETGMWITNDLLPFRAASPPASLSGASDHAHSSCSLLCLHSMSRLCFFEQARCPEILKLKGSVCIVGALGTPDLTMGLCVQNCRRRRASTDGL